MIHENLANLLQVELPDLKWSSNFYALNSETGTVYVNGGDGVGRYESPIIRPSYQVLIRSKDWDKAELYAHDTLKLLDKRANEIVTAHLYRNGTPVRRLTVKIIYLENFGGVLNLGVVEDDVREYSINFDATLRIIKEEEL